MKSSNQFLAGGGEMGERIRALDWSRTPLGAIETWPQSLRSALSILLPSKAQIALFWGEDLITLYNDAYRPVFGAKHPRALGQPIRESWDELWRDGLKELFDGVLATGEAFWATDRPFFMERHGYLEETYFDVSYDPVRDESGQVGGVFCIVSETTARVVGERRLRLLRDLGRIAQQAQDVPEVYRLAAEVLAGCPLEVPFALLLARDGEGPAQIVGRCGLPEANRDAWARVASGGGTASPMGEAPRLLQGEDLAPIGPLHAGPWPEPIVQVKVVPFAPPGEAPHGCLVAGISPRRRADEDQRDFLKLAAAHIASAVASVRRNEDERRRARMLAELDRAKTAFFSNVSHEFRTPLTLLLGPLEEALDDTQPLAAAQRERLEMARRGALRMQKLVNALLDFSRIEAGRARASYVPTDLAAFTAELASSFRSAVEKAGLRLDVACPPLPQPAYVDRDMWEKIVLNLLSNAFKFTFEGGIAVSLRSEGDAFVLEVRDTGTGIPAGELPNVFQRFRRVEGARSRTQEGTGIGLALVQELARLHGGTVHAESEQGRGSRFVVSIPAGRAHLPPEHVSAAASPAAGAEAFVQEALRWLPDAEPELEAPAPGGDGRKPRILLADDNADVRDYIRRLLKPHYHVIAVADGAAALALLRKHPFDLLLADVMMPQLDGLELVRAVRTDAALRDLPVLLLSARAGEASRIEGLAAGADDYVEKPFGARELLARVAARLEIAALRRDAAAGLRQRAAQLRFVTDHVPVLIVQCDSQARYTFVNRPYAERFGLDPLEVVGRTIPEVVGEEAYESFRHHVQAVLAGERVHFEQCIPYPRLGERWMECAYVPHREPGGQVSGFVAVIQDVTDKHEVAQALRESEAALREADRRKNEFLATLAHELRNPLAPLRNALHVLRMPGAEGRDPARAYELMERQVHHLVRLVDDLLEISRISRGALELRKERVDLAAVVRNAVETSEPLIHEAGHELVVSLPPEPLWVEGDAVRLAQVFSNLLNNAARYTDRGGRIELRAQARGAEVSVSVRDNGNGFEPGAADRLFEMFRRGESSSGLGVGLALARSLVAMHGGRVDGHSDGPGRGAEFKVVLPRAEGTGAAEEAPAPVGHAMPALRILVVDDNQDAADSLQMLLKLLGAEAHVAHDGPAALREFEALAPHVVLLDIGMPGMDGYAVARAIRSRWPQRRCGLVALTGWGQEQDRLRGREAGFDHHLVKPADIDALQALLTSLAAQQQAAGAR